MNVLDNPSLKALVMEAIGRKLIVFWNINKMNTVFCHPRDRDRRSLLSAPMKGHKK
jgi:hypothetical protein